MNSLINGDVKKRLFLGCFFMVITNITFYTLINFMSIEQVQKGYVTFVLDDGTLNQFEEIYPMFSERNLTATWPIIISKVDSDDGYAGYESIAKVFEDKPGWEIVSHTVNHPKLSELELSDIEKELKYSKDALMDFNTNFLVYPYYNYDENVIEVAKKYYRAAFAGSLDDNNEPRGNSGSTNINNINYKDYLNYKDNKYLIKRVTITSGGKIPHSRGEEADWRKLINVANETGGWLVFCIHDVNEESKAKLQSLLDYIVENKIRVISTEEALELFLI